MNIKYMYEKSTDSESEAFDAINTCNFNEVYTHAIVHLEDTIYRNNSTISILIDIVTRLVK